MSLLSNLTKLARSPQGKKALAKAQEMAKDPATKAKIDDARRKLQGRGKGGGGTPPPAPTA